MRPESEAQEDSVHACTAGLPRTQVSFSEVFVRGRPQRRGRSVELVGNSGQNVVPKSKVCKIVIYFVYILILLQLYDTIIYYTDAIRNL